MLRSGALEPESLLFTPVVAGDRPRGGIVTIWWSRRHEFSRDDFNLAAGVASQLALALENARLYRSVQGALDEARSAQAEMARTETLRALGQFADGAAHHLNNLLAVALGRIQLALLKRAPVEAASELTTAQKAIRDSADIIRRLHDFGAGRPLGPLELVNLNDVVRAADADAPVVWQDEVARRGTSIELALAEDLPVVNAVRKPLQEALRNLIVNAVEAIPSSGSIVIRTWAEASSVYCAVIDHGVGMSGEIARRAIEPFFTTKGLQRRGLGLSASHGIIARHGGELRVESHMGQGTTVTVRLPIAHAPDQV